MRNLLIAAAVGVFLPAMAHAEPAPTSTAMECCDKVKAEGKKCCCCGEVDKKDHAEHDMSKMDHGKH